jgi:hypothetical protein
MVTEVESDEVPNNNKQSKTVVKFNEKVNGALELQKKSSNSDDCRQARPSVVFAFPVARNEMAAYFHHTFHSM